MEKEVSSFLKNKFQDVRISIREFKGNNLLDIRIWTASQSEGKMIPTAKGISIRLDLLPKLKESLSAVEKFLKENKINS